MINSSYDLLVIPSSVDIWMQNIILNYISFIEFRKAPFFFTLYNEKFELQNDILTLHFEFYI